METALTSPLTLQSNSRMFLSCLLKREVDAFQFAELLGGFPVDLILSFHCSPFSVFGGFKMRVRETSDFSPFTLPLPVPD